MSRAGGVGSGEGPETNDPLAEMYRLALRIRLFELRTQQLRDELKIPGDVHLYLGQEGVAAAVGSVIRQGDAVTSTHRCHGHALAKGVSPESIFAELLGRDAGVCRGRGGSMHIAEPRRGFLGGNGIVAGGLPMANGAAFAAQRRGQGDLVVAFFGDGAVGQGAFHEAVNLAVQWSLPVLFLCENNKYAASTALDDAQLSLETRASGYELRCPRVDGEDPIGCRSALLEIVTSIREAGGPRMVEADTWRWAGHWDGDAEDYRSEEEVSEARGHDPVWRLAADLRARGVPTQTLETLRHSVEEEIDRAAAWALEQPEPDPSRIADFVVGKRLRANREASAGRGRRFRGIDAVHAALREEMQRDETVILAGVDLNVGVTGKLQRRWPDRVLATPISETAIMGWGVGASMSGLRPVVEVLFMDFITVCFDQIANQAAKLQFMSGGGVSLPLTIRTQFGSQTAAGPQHSQSLEALLAHVPGLTVVMPATPADTYGLLRAAIREDNPVVVVEHRSLYDLSGQRPGPEHVVEIGQAQILREGSDVTLIAASRMVQEAMLAAGRLADEGIDCEVLDLRTIVPLDRDAIVRSASKTGRVVVAQEAVCDFGVGAEIAAVLAEQAFEHLRAPVVRVGAPATPVPYAPSLERRWVPGAEEIVAAARRLATTPARATA